MNGTRACMSNGLKFQDKCRNFIYRQAKRIIPAAVLDMLLFNTHIQHHPSELLTSDPYAVFEPIGLDMHLKCSFASKIGKQVRLQVRAVSL